MASIEALTDASEAAILSEIVDLGRAVTPEQYVARKRVAELEAENSNLRAALMQITNDAAVAAKPDYQTMHKQLCRIAAVQMDWYQGLTSAQDAMIEISQVFQFNNAR